MISQEKKEFYVDIVNVAVFNGILEQWALIKNNSHNRFSGAVSFKIEDDPDKILHKINAKDIKDAVEKICTEVVDNLDDEIEKNVLLANKRNDASYLEEDDVNAIFQLAAFGEIG